MINDKQTKPDGFAAARVCFSSCLMMHLSFIRFAVVLGSHVFYTVRLKFALGPVGLSSILPAAGDAAETQQRHDGVAQRSCRHHLAQGVLVSINVSPYPPLSDNYRHLHAPRALHVL